MKTMSRVSGSPLRLMAIIAMSCTMPSPFMSIVPRPQT